MKFKKKLFEIDDYISKNPIYVNEYNKLLKFFDYMEIMRSNIIKIKIERTALKQEIPYDERNKDRLKDLFYNYYKYSNLKARNLLSFIETLEKIIIKDKQIRKDLLSIEYGMEEKYNKYWYVAIFFNNKRLFCYHISNILFKRDNPTFGNFLWNHLLESKFSIRKDNIYNIPEEENLKDIYL